MNRQCPSCGGHNTQQFGDAANQNYWIAWTIFAFLAVLISCIALQLHDIALVTITVLGIWTIFKFVLPHFKEPVLWKCNLCNYVWKLEDKHEIRTHSDSTTMNEDKTYRWITIVFVSIAIGITFLGSTILPLLLLENPVGWQVLIASTMLYFPLIILLIAMLLEQKSRHKTQIGKLLEMQDSSRRQFEEMTSRMEELSKRKIEETQELSRKQIEQMQETSRRQIEELTSKIQELSRYASLLERESIIGLRKRWFAEIANGEYKHEADVEVKFVYPFIRFLGYDFKDVRFRSPVSLTVGRQKVNGIADCVVLKSGKPFIVFEVKEQSRRLDHEVQEQARSYAYALKAPFYVLTNGREVVIFERNVNDDNRIFRTTSQELETNWSSIEKVIGKEAQFSPELLTPDNK